MVRDGTKNKLKSLKTGGGPGRVRWVQGQQPWARGGGGGIQVAKGFKVPHVLPFLRLTEMTETVVKKSTDTYTPKIFSTDLVESREWPLRNLISVWCKYTYQQWDVKVDDCNLTKYEAEMSVQGSHRLSVTKFQDFSRTKYVFSRTLMCYKLNIFAVRLQKIENGDDC